MTATLSLTIIAAGIPVMFWAALTEPSMIRSLDLLPARLGNWLANRSTPATFSLCLIAAVVLVAALDGVPR